MEEGVVMGEMRWIKDKTQIHIEDINFVSNDIYEAVLGAVRELIKTNNPDKETPMTPNERLLKAAIASSEKWNERLGAPEIDANYIRIMDELEDAVKACEAAEANDAVTESQTATEATRKFLLGAGTPTIRWTPIEGINPFLDMSSDRPTITDQQRRLGLRSLRHMRKDYANWDYD